MACLPFMKIVVVMYFYGLAYTFSRFFIFFCSFYLKVPQVLAVDVKDSDKDYIILDIEILWVPSIDFYKTFTLIQQKLEDECRKTPPLLSL